MIFLRWFACPAVILPVTAVIGKDDDATFAGDTSDSTRIIRLSRSIDRVIEKRLHDENIPPAEIADDA